MIKYFSTDGEVDASHVRVVSKLPQLASGVEVTVAEQVWTTEGRVVNNGVKIKSKLVIPFYKLTGDMYVVTDYSQEMKLLYNERSLGIFLKETSDLVQIKRSNIIEIHDFFYGVE